MEKTHYITSSGKVRSGSTMTLPGGTTVKLVSREAYNGALRESGKKLSTESSQRGKTSVSSPAMSVKK